METQAAYTTAEPPSDSLVDRRQHPYAMVETALLRDPRIPPQCKALYGLLITYGPQRIFPGQQTLADCLGATRQTVIRWLSDLKECGLIGWERRVGTSNLYYILGYENYNGGCNTHVTGDVTPTLQGCNTGVTGDVTPVLHDLKPLKQEPPTTNQGTREGADAPALSEPDGWSWQETLFEEDPAQERLDKMRARLGSDPFTVGLHCAEAQEREGAWTVPEVKGLSPQCAVVKDATGYTPTRATRPVIEERIPNNSEALEMWHRVCQGWMLAGNKPTNIGGMLDWYAEGRVGYSKPQKRNNGNSTPRQADVWEVDEPEPDTSLIDRPEHLRRWQLALEFMASSRGKGAVIQWLNGSQLLEYGNGRAVVELANRYSMEFVPDNWGADLKTALAFPDATEPALTFVEAGEQVIEWV